MDLLSEFNQERGITSQPIRKITERKRRTAKSIHNISGQEAEETLSAQPESSTLIALSSLLNEENLSLELQRLENGLYVLKASGGYKVPDVAGLVKLLVQRQSNNNCINEVLQTLHYIPSSSSPSNFLGPTLIFHRLESALAVFSSLLVQSQQLAIIQRAVSMEACRALVVIYDWFCQSGPLIVASLFDAIHFHGFERLRIMFPQFSDAVKHVYEYVKTYISVHAEPVAHPSLDAVQVVTRQPEYGQALTRLLELGTIQGDLYGLFRGTKKEREILVLAAPEGKMLTTQNYLYQQSKNCFMELLTRILVADPMRKLDAMFTRAAGKHSSTDAAIRGRNIVRGAVLYTLSQLCGTEAIFASDNIRGILFSPGYLLGGWSEKSVKPERLVSQMMRSGQESMFEPLKSYIAERLTPGVISSADALGQFIHHRILEFDQGHPISDLAYLNTEYVDEPSGRQSKPKKSVKRHQLKRVNLDMILQKMESLNFNKIALILREVVNNQRGFTSVNEELGNLARGLLPNGSGNADDDFVNPIRERNTSTLLLKEKFKNEPVTSSMGLSNLLVWMGTGQGYRTKVFIQEGPMFFVNLSSCVSRFQQVIDRNNRAIAQALSAGAGQESESDANCVSTPESINRFKELPQYVHIDNQTFYSTANHNLAVLQTVQDSTGCKTTASVENKFRPYFEPAVCERWLEFLGFCRERAVSTLQSSELHLWSEGLSLVENLEVSGFGSGLTSFQTTNMLAILGLCKHPTPKEMAEWVATHSNMGACAALMQIGFITEGISEIMAAFLSFHHFLEIHLSLSDKDLLCFSPIFTEHLLCKTKRWSWFLQRHGVSLDNIADQEHKALNTGEQAEWIQNGNVSDHFQFPIPVVWPIEKLEPFLNSLG